MNKKQKQTLEAIFAKQIPATINWKDIESLFRALGAEISDGRGSRRRVALNERLAVFHRPHPEKETDRGAVKSVQRFLIEAGIQPPGGNK